MTNKKLIIRFLYITICLTHLISCKVINYFGDEYSNYKIYHNLNNALKNRYKVRILDLSGKKLNSIPDNVEFLKELRVLNLGSNNFVKFPEQILKLKNLEVLILSNNKLNTLPIEIGELSNLKTLELMKNDLSELPNSLGKLGSLKRLNLTLNNIQDEDVAFLKKALPDCLVMYYVLL